MITDAQVVSIATDIDNLFSEFRIQQLQRPSQQSNIDASITSLQAFADDLDAIITALSA